ncbi:MAG: hypothetical protein NC831_01350 [Candidatus Omnitrophica bacterium]|nr:hypothetical protein [Candidatus Omnitrophota bacterium]
MVSSKDYMKLIERWLGFARGLVRQVGGRPELEYFGTGYNNWAVQTHQKAFSAFAVCAVDPDLDEKNCQMKRDEILYHALKMLRFNLETHIQGSFFCLDGTKWGHTWISALGIERMMHGIDAIKEYLTDYDRKLLEKVMVSESDWLVDDYFRDMPERKGEVLAGKTIHNHPESNIWNGAHLLRTVLLFPDVKRKKEYIEKATTFIINGISISSDAKCKEPVNGKPVSYWYRGDNFFPSFALNHHGYLNTGYMVICLSNIAMLHFACKKANIKPPDFIYRHIDRLWKLVKSFTFSDGRLCRIGGDTRIRYCYCQDYAIPVWLLIRDLYGDSDCENFEKGWLEIIRKEMDANKDGSFLSIRCQDLYERAPIYYARLETDRACTLSMAAYWKRIFSHFNQRKPIKISGIKQWYDRHHGACFVRGKNRIASWCWLAAQPPQGLCVPSNRSDFAEWRHNLAGVIGGYGRINFQSLVYHKEFVFDNGFAVYGETKVCSESFLSEGHKPEVLAKNNIVFVALPDDTTCIVMQRSVAIMPETFLYRAKGLFLNIPNDIFNGCERTYWFEGGNKKIKGPSEKQEIIRIQSGWLNVDNRLGIVSVYGGDSFTIFRPAKRQAGLNLNQFEAEAISTGLFADEICYPYREKIAVRKDSSIFDICCVVLAGKNRRETQRFFRKGFWIPEIETDCVVKAIGITGFDGKKYLVLANYGRKQSSVKIKLPGYKKAKRFFKNKNFSISNEWLCLDLKNIELLVVK